MTEREYVRALTKVQALLAKAHDGITLTGGSPTTATQREIWLRGLLREANSLVNEALLRGPTEHMGEAR
jgi:hypothetical protein